MTKKPVEPADEAVEQEISEEQAEILFYREENADLQDQLDNVRRILDLAGVPTKNGDDALSVVQRLLALTHQMKIIRRALEDVREDAMEIALSASSMSPTQIERDLRDVVDKSQKAALIVVISQ